MDLSPDLIREFVIAGHGNLDKVKTMHTENPHLLNAAHDWGRYPGDTETALQGASHVGNRIIAEYLLEQGAPMHITTAAMLGQVEVVRQMLEADPTTAHAEGAHRISLMAHAVHSMNTELLQMLLDHGASMDAQALFVPIAVGRADVVNWLLQHGATDLSIQNFKGQTPIDAAEAAGFSEIVELLRAYQ
jgi:ankyrin repeat protein